MFPTYFIAMFPTYLIYFCAPKTKSMSQARINPKILSNLGLNPFQKAGPTYNSVSAAINLRWKNIGISIVGCHSGANLVRVTK